MKEHYTIEADILAYYAQGLEQSRLSVPDGRLEYLRTSELLARYLPQPPAIVLDVGGGAGVYALPLAMQGYEVHLIDPIPLHVEQAAQASQAQPCPLHSIAVGDARCLHWPETSLDAVLLLGPLYHLSKRRDRLTALREAYRVLRPGGVAIVAAIARFASTLDGLWGNRWRQPAFNQDVERALSEGQRREPTAYAHRPEELHREIKTAGFQLEALVAVEGPGWLMPKVEEWLADPEPRDTLLRVLQKIEGETSLIGASAHMLAIGRRRKGYGSKN